MSKCPYCDFEIVAVSDPFFAAQLEVAHMNQNHPEIVEQRLREHGFVKTPDGRWVDAWSDPND
jgi:hypothetical protein